MSNIRYFLVFFLAIVLHPTFVRAEFASRMVGSQRFDFVLPQGQCLLVDNNPHDAKFIHTVGTLFKGAQNTLIIATMECGLRAKLRRGESGNILDYAAYYTPDTYVEGTVPGDQAEARKSLCVDMRAQGDATLDGVKDIVAKAAKELRSNMAVSTTKYIGVMDEDEHGCYAALLVGVRGAGDKPILMSSVVTSTVSRSKPLFLAIYSEYKGPETTNAGVRAAQATLEEFDQKNQ
jgi:hypothetical protein